MMYPLSEIEKPTGEYRLRRRYPEWLQGGGDKSQNWLPAPAEISIYYTNFNGQKMLQLTGIAAHHRQQKFEVNRAII